MEAGETAYGSVGAVEAWDRAAHEAAAGGRLMRQWTEGSGGDVDLRLGDATERVHSAVLRTFCPGLAPALAAAELSEAGRRQLHLPQHLSKRGLGKVLEWLYTGSTRLRRRDGSLGQTWAAAAALGVEDLLDKLEDWLLESLDDVDFLVDAVPLLYRHGGSWPTKLAVLGHALQPSVFQKLAGSVERLPLRFVVQLLASDHLPVSRELDALRIAVRALERQFRAGSLDELSQDLVLGAVRWERLGRTEADEATALLRSVRCPRLQERLAELLHLATGPVRSPTGGLPDRPTAVRGRDVCLSASLASSAGRPETTPPVAAVTSFALPAEGRPSSASLPRPAASDYLLPPSQSP